MARHVVWDWNGTLLDDFDVVLSAMNAACVAVGMPTLTAQRYRETFSRPIERAYERLLGRPLRPGEWERVNHEFHVSYNEIYRSAALAADAVEVLDELKQAGVTQSLLSMWVHEELVPVVEGYGVAGYFVRIDGQPGRGGGHKQEHLEAHVARLASELPAPVPVEEMLLVGDSLDDVQAARAVGMPCVLLDSGPHLLDDIRACGAPVASSLSDAIRRAGALPRS